MGNRVSINFMLNGPPGRVYHLPRYSIARWRYERGDVGPPSQEFSKQSGAMCSTHHFGMPMEHPMHALLVFVALMRVRSLSAFPALNLRRWSARLALPGGT